MRVQSAVSGGSWRLTSGDQLIHVTIKFVGSIAAMSSHSRAPRDLSCYFVRGIVILDNDGNRLIAKVSFVFYKSILSVLARDILNLSNLMATCSLLYSTTAIQP